MIEAPITMYVLPLAAYAATETALQSLESFCACRGDYVCWGHRTLCTLHSTTRDELRAVAAVGAWLVAIGGNR